MASSSSSDRKKEENLYEAWMKNQQEEVIELENAANLSRNHQKNDNDLKQLLTKTVNNFQSYVDGRRVLARVDVSPYFAPTWCTPLENSVIWIGGCRPSSYIRLIYALCGMEIESRMAEFLQGANISEFGQLSGKQISLVDKLQRQIIMEERKLSSRYALLQEDVVDQPIAIACVAGQGESGGEPLNKHGLEMTSLLGDADDLRMKMLKEILVILTPIQGVIYIAAAKKIRLCLQNWGKKREKEHSK